MKIRAQQIEKLTKLEHIFKPDKLKHNKFVWKERVDKAGEYEWLPRFEEFWKPAQHQTPSLTDIWKENRTGIGLLFSIKELEEHWGARWKQNKGTIKTEAVRRGKVVTTIERLIARYGWTPEQALTYLRARYPIPTKGNPHLKSLRAFYDYLGRKDGAVKDVGIGEVVDVASDFVFEAAGRL